MNGIWIGLLVIILVPVMLIAWSGKRKQLGTIKCNRCHYIGPASGTWRPFKGIVPTCGKCGGEDWQVIAGSHHTNIYDDTEVRLAALKVPALPANESGVALATMHV